MIRMVGDKEVSAVLLGLPLQVNANLLSNSFTDAAKPMVESIKSFTPTGETDNLIESIGIVKERNIVDNVAIGQIQLGPRRKGRYKGHIGHILEFGTTTRKTKSGANRGSVKAVHFMQKGFDATQTQVLGRINTSIGRKLEQFIRRTVKT